MDLSPIYNPGLKSGDHNLNINYHDTDRESKEAKGPEPEC